MTTKATFAGRGRLVAVATVLGALLSGLGVAQTRAISSDLSLVQIMASASRELLLASPEIQNYQVANQIRALAVTKGIKVFILSSPEETKLTSSYLQGLSLTDNVTVKLLSGLSQGRLLIDQRYLISGPLVLRPQNPIERRQTSLDDQQPNLKRYRDWFITIWRVASPYTYSPSLPRKK
jgi:hypothetical protein